MKKLSKLKHKAACRQIYRQLVYYPEVGKNIYEFDNDRNKICFSVKIETQNIVYQK